jgi:hypothetical protein
MNIINSEVPTACFMGKLAKNNKAGIIKTSTSPKTLLLNQRPIKASIKS